MARKQQCRLCGRREIDQRGLFDRLYDDLIVDADTGKHYGVILCSYLASSSVMTNAKRESEAFLRFALQSNWSAISPQVVTGYLSLPRILRLGCLRYRKRLGALPSKTSQPTFVTGRGTIYGLIKNPRMFSPPAHPDRALARWNEVIKAMSERGSMTSEQAGQAAIASLGTAIDLKPNL